MPFNEKEANAKLAFYTELGKTKRLTGDELMNARIDIGSMRPIARHLGKGKSRFSRFLWRLFDVEYTR